MRAAVLILLVCAAVAMAVESTEPPKPVETPTQAPPAKLKKNGKSVLLWTFPYATSHNLVFAKLGRELAARGNTVHIVRTNVDSDKVDYTGLTPYDIVLENTTRESMAKDNYELGQLSPLDGLVFILDLVGKQCASFDRDGKLRQLYESVDVVVIDSNYGCACLFAGLWKHKHRIDLAPAAFVDPYSTITYGVSSSPFRTPLTGPGKPANMNFAQRLENTIVYLFGVYSRFYVVEPRLSEVAEQLGYGPLKLYDTFDTVELMLYPTTFEFNFPRVVPPNAKLVGPMLPEAPKPIVDRELASFIDDAKEGFVLVSFGTIAEPSPEQTQNLLHAAKTLNIPLIWKYNGKQNLHTEGGLLVRKWIPQNDLLGHPKCRAFVTHGGINGVLEAAYHGVPLVGFPMFADQFTNVAMAEWRGMGLSIDKDTATQASIETVLHRVFGEASFRDNAKAIARRVQDVPKEPTAQAADWVEYVIRHNGAGHLRLPDLDNSFSVRMGFDVIAALVAVALSPLLILYLCCRCIRCRRSKQKKA